MRLFKDITYNKLNPVNWGHNNPNNRKIKKTHYNKKLSIQDEPDKVVFCENINELDDKHMVKEPFGYAQIDLINDLISESDTDSLPANQYNSKLDVMQNAFDWLQDTNIERMLHEVGNYKNYLVYKSD